MDGTAAPSSLSLTYAGAPVTSMQDGLARLRQQGLDVIAS